MQFLGKNDCGDRGLYSLDLQLWSQCLLARAMQQERPASKPLALRGAQHRFGLTKRSFGKFEVLGMMGLVRKTRK